MSELDVLIDSEGCLDRLSRYGQEELSGDIGEIFCQAVCNGEGGDQCDDCPVREIMIQVEYDIQTEIILSAKKLIEDWAEGSIHK